MASFLRSSRARWAVPVGVIAVTAASVTVIPRMADANPGLPPRTAAAVLADLAKAGQAPFAGTVVTTARLGLPDLPSTGGATSLQSLVSGSHTVRVWYASPLAVRAALVGDLAETDVIRNGRDLWLWDSAERTSKHATLPAELAASPSTPTPADLTPTEAARRALTAIDPSTEVAVEGTDTVAGRGAYTLVLRPRDADSLIGQVRLGIDAKTATPLQVQVYPRGAGIPAFDTRFTAIDFSTPPSSVFVFTPPPGATVSELGSGTRLGGEAAVPGQAPAQAPSDAPLGAVSGMPAEYAASTSKPVVVGSGWGAVVIAAGVTLREGQDLTVDTLLRSAKPVSGTGWSGRLVTTRLLSVILTDDGRLAVGAVTPAAVARALSSPTKR